MMDYTNQILNMDCLDGLRLLPDRSINMCVTSPPYFGLRNYGHDGQMGLEETPELYVQKMVDVFRQVRRTLKNDGTLWLNIGDSYSGSGKGIGDTKTNNKGNSGSREGIFIKTNTGLKAKDLIGIPWMLAFALRKDGWYLRQEIIWHKPSCMPESVTDRCTKNHEHIFLLSKKPKYYYDADAISEPTTTRDDCIRDRDITKLNNTPGRTKSGGLKTNDYERRNKRTVWTVTTKPFKEAHFATFPEELIVDCIKAGCPEGGLVLDPFMGAGTTALVARKLNRNYIGIELNPEYVRIAHNRLQNELGIFL